MPLKLYQNRADQITSMIALNALLTAPPIYARFRQVLREWCNQHQRRHILLRHFSQLRRVAGMGRSKWSTPFILRRSRLNSSRHKSTTACGIEKVILNDFATCNP
jgi:hypothetical protein